MAFWSRPSLQPQRQHRFRVVFTKSQETLLREAEDRIREDLAASQGSLGATIDLSGRVGQVAIAQESRKLPPSDYWWWVKSCTLPSFEVGQQEYQLINFKFKYPGMLVWNDVVISLVEVGDKADEILKILGAAGYACPGSECGSGIEKSGFRDQGQLRIEQLSSTGNANRSWDLRNWFIKGVRFGEQNYESDDLVTIEMTIGYDCAILE